MENGKSGWPGAFLQDLHFLKEKPVPRVCKPDSVLAGASRHSRRSFISLPPVPCGIGGRAERRATYPGPLGGPPGPLFGLAPDWVYRASDVAVEAVGSYPAFSSLPAALARDVGGLFSVTLSVTAALAPAPPLSRGILPCGVRTFLSPPPKR